MQFATGFQRGTHFLWKPKRNYNQGSQKHAVYFCKA